MEVSNASRDSRAQRTVEGTVRYSAGHTLPHGTSLTTNFVRFNSVDTGGAVAIRNWDVFSGVLASFHFARDGRQRITGSGVAVGPGIFLGATHVIEPEAPQMERGEIGGTITAIAPHGMMIWHPLRIVADASCDIAIITASCGTDLPPGNILPLAVMSARTPRTGERITICGFRPGADEFSHGLSDEIAGDVYVSSGRVTQIFPNGRDRYMVPWPSVEVSCYTHGAMSGGPAFDEMGRLIGVLATSLETTDRRGPSYVSLLSPALLLQFYPVWPVRATSPVFLRQSAPHLWQVD